MNCQELSDSLTDLLDGALAPPEEAAASAHLAACAACAALHARMSSVVAMLAELAEVEAPEGLAERVLERVPRAAPRIGGPPARRPWELRRVAGWGLILLGIGWQAGGGELAGRAMGGAAPVIAQAQQTVARARKEGGISGELERATTGLSGLARGLRNTQRVLNPPAEGRNAT
jgi:anti-sigma factor RsiW